MAAPGEGKLEGTEPLSVLYREAVVENVILQDKLAERDRQARELAL